MGLFNHPDDRDGKVYHILLIKVRAFINHKHERVMFADLFGKDEIRIPVRYMPMLALYNESAVSDFNHGFPPLYGAN